MVWVGADTVTTLRGEATISPVTAGRFLSVQQYLDLLTRILDERHVGVSAR